MKFCPVCMFREAVAGGSNPTRLLLPRKRSSQQHRNRRRNDLSAMSLSTAKMGNRSSWVAVRWASLTKRSTWICAALGLFDRPLTKRRTILAKLRRAKLLAADDAHHPPTGYASFRSRILWGTAPESTKRGLVHTINLYLAQHNLEPKRYVWHADGQEVLNKINRAWEAATNPATY
jgi:hypothetical protein